MGQKIKITVITSTGNEEQSAADVATGGSVMFGTDLEKGLDSENVLMLPGYYHLSPKNKFTSRNTGPKPDIPKSINAPIGASTDDS